MDRDVEKRKGDFRCDLIKAIENKDAADVSKLLIGGVNVNFRMIENGPTPLQIAASNGSAEIVKILLDHGANVDQPHGCGPIPFDEGARDVDYHKFHGERTPLQEAALKGSAEIVKILLDDGANANQPHGCGPIPFYIGAGNVHSRVIEGGRTPLQIAASKGSAKICKILLDHGANAMQSDRFGRTAVHFALKRFNKFMENDLEALLLEAGTDWNAKYVSVKGPSNYNWCFDPACDHKDCGVMIINRSPFGKEVHTLLHFAVKEGHASAVKLVLEQKGVDIDCQDEVGLTPLMMSLIFKRQEVFDVLLEFGADCNEKMDDDQCLPLHHALRLRNYRAVEVLVKKMDLRILRNYSERRDGVIDIFSFACKYSNNFQFILLLLEKGFPFAPLCSWTHSIIGGVPDICIRTEVGWIGRMDGTPFVSLLVNTEPKLANYECCLPLTLLLGFQCYQVLPILTKLADQGMKVNPPPNSDAAPTLPICHMTSNMCITLKMWVQIFSFLESQGFDPDYTSRQNSIGFPDMLVCASMNNAPVLALLLRFSRNAPVALLEKWTCFLTQLSRNGNRLNASSSALFAQRMEAVALVCTTLGIPSTERVKVTQFQNAVKAVTGVERDWDHIYSGMDPVPSLLHMCRTTIRNQLSKALIPGQMMKDVVEGLEIPHLLAPFLLYKDIDIRQFPF